MPNKMNWDEAASIERCKKYRRRILEVSQQVSALHVAPAFSCIEILDVIYNGLISGPFDCFIMSKGHAAVAQYVILEDRGLLVRQDLDLYCKPGGRLGAHPDYGTPGIEASTGSLGHGLSIAVGRAHALKVQGFHGKVYCLLSDGEMQEGSTWEAMMMAANLRLDNLTVFVDNNDYGGLAKISEQHPALYSLVSKAEAFCWRACGASGHDSKDIFWSATTPYGVPQVSPRFVCCDTVKGYPISYMIENSLWHYRSPNLEEYQQALRELEYA